MEIKAVIFDLDGVIVSTDELHYHAWKRLADELKIYFDRELNNKLRGVSRMESLEIILRQNGKDYPLEEKQMLVERKNEYYVKSLITLSPEAVPANAVKTIQAIKAQGIKVAIGSSSKNAGIILKQIGLCDAFDAISDGNNITHSKPHPEVFEKAAKMLGMQPESCLVVEDARAGIDAAKSAGMMAAGIGDAAAYEKTDYPVSDIYEIMGIVIHRRKETP